MSRRKFAKMVNIRTAEYTTLYGMDTNQTKVLADRVREIIRDKKLTHRGVEERAKRKGYQIAHSYISKIKSGTADNLTVERLIALAVGLDVPVEEILLAAAGKDGKKETDLQLERALFYFKGLTATDRKLIIELLETMRRRSESAEGGELQATRVQRRGTEATKLLPGEETGKKRKKG